ncbi:MAG: sensor histidine kinase [Bacteroidales bacterium]|nr:sensor histidine kinase [Bacteroidales bacterium]
MKTSKGYPILITLLVVLLIAAALIVNELTGFKHPFLDYVILGLIVAGGTFLIVRLFFIRFVESKINPIFKTIHSYTMSQKKLRDKIDKGDVISDLNLEVKIWADNQTEEIKKLRQLEKYRKDFMGNVSHELKTPIFNIQGYILTLLDGGMEDISVNKLYLKRAEKSINRLISIVDDLDSIARLESGEFKLRLEPFNLVKVVEEAIEDQEMQAKQQNIKIGFDGNYNKPIKAIGDKRRIREVISNLINNSIKYGRVGGKTTIGFIDTGENILVDISDNGIGIDEKDLPRIFERFYRVDRSRSRESGGTGLGLSIAKHTIQAHNQTITVRSKVDKGTTFIFSLDKA